MKPPFCFWYLETFNVEMAIGLEVCMWLDLWLTFIYYNESSLNRWGRLLYFRLMTNFNTFENFFFFILDPKQRLLLFRKLEETSHYPHVQGPNRKILPRKEYFQGRNLSLYITKELFAGSTFRIWVRSLVRSNQWLYYRLSICCFSAIYSSAFKM